MTFFRAYAAITAALCITAATAHADSMWIAGAEASGHNATYGQLGVITALPGSSLGNGFVVRGVGYGLTYSYQAATSGIDASGAGAEAAVGYQQSGPGGWWGAYTGPAWRHTTLDPKDPASDAEGNQFGWMVQGEGERNFGRQFKGNVAASYTFNDSNAYWARARALARVKNEMFVGPEFTYQGDRDYSAWAFGAGVFGIEIAPNAALGVKAGVRKVEELSAAPYGGVELSGRF